MSLRIAAVITGFANAVTLPMSRRQKRKTMARVTHSLERGSALETQTPRGSLKFLASRGAGTASAVERFLTDEPETLEWIDQWVKPGDTLWDIGASIGLYSLYAALNPEVRVLVFEPSALNFGLLAEHVALNNMGARVTPLCIALSGETKLDYLHMSHYETGSAGNALGQAENQFNMAFKPLFSQGIPAITADDFVRVFKVQPPQHIKLDVDGIEGAILKEMGDLLPHAKTVIIEVEGNNAAQAAELIEKPLSKAGFTEEMACRSKGSKRNRLYINKSRA